MINFDIEFTDEADEDLQSLDGSVRKQIIKGINKVSTNPYPVPKGYGKPLGNKGSIELTGFLKVKFLSAGLRVIYYLKEEQRVMLIVSISQRSDNYCYIEAFRRFKKLEEQLKKGF